MRGTWETTDSGGGGILIAVLTLGAVAAVAGPVIAALTSLVELLFVIVYGLLGLAALGGIALVAVRLRRGRRNSPLVVHQVPPVTRPAAESLSAPRRSAAALPPAGRPEVHLHFHGVDAAEVAAILADVNREHRPDVP